MAVTAEQRYGITNPNPINSRVAEIPITAHWHLPQPRPTAYAMADKSLPVEVNDDRWIVRCPCGGAQLASWTDRRFFCVDCAMAWTGGKWVTVTWPANPAAVEAALDVRPERHTRSWTPNQSVKDLHRENDDHGVPA